MKWENIASLTTPKILLTTVNPLTAKNLRPIPTDKELIPKTDPEQYIQLH
jgi:hypothetical protein